VFSGYTHKFPASLNLHFLRSNYSLPQDYDHLNLRLQSTVRIQRKLLSQRRSVKETRFLAPNESV
jgi:hypothetical protein